jgi:imidazolonepropionase-like amidohydrolase
VPTLSAPRAVLAQAEAGAAISDRVLAKARMVAEVHDDSFRRAVDAGVRVAMGTDAGVGVHGANLEEVRLMAELGLGPQRAWEATCRSAAELLGVEADHGTLEPGKVGDVVVLDGALDDLEGLRERVRSVHVAGVRAFTRGADAGA